MTPDGRITSEFDDVTLDPLAAWATGGDDAGDERDDEADAVFDDEGYELDFLPELLGYEPGAR